MVKGFILLVLCALLSGCAAVAPLSSLLSTTQSGPPPLQVHEQTTVQLARDDFSLVKTNVIGASKGFSLLGVITIVPPTLTKAMNRLYASAQMQPGTPETVAHLVIEQTTSFFILFGIPKIEVRADIIEFKARSQNDSASAKRALRSSGVACMPLRSKNRAAPPIASTVHVNVREIVARF